jgi:hypothetical protein
MRLRAKDIKRRIPSSSIDYCQIAAGFCRFVSVARMGYLRLNFCHDFSGMMRRAETYRYRTKEA